jgi:flagellum-specific peptidoglycan hydrolase FlgJ
MSFDANMQYLYTMFPYAKAAHAATGVFTSVILAQWAHETGFGTSDVAHNANNHGGIKYVEGASIASGKYGAYASYFTLDQFAQDYSRVLNLSYYELIRGASTPEEAIADFNVEHNGEKYAEDPAYSQEVLSIYNQYGCSGFDTYQGGAAPAAPATGGGVSADTAKLAAVGAAFLALIALTNK